MATLQKPPMVTITCPDADNKRASARIVVTAADGSQHEIQHLVTRVAIDLAYDDINRAQLEISPAVDVEAYLDRVTIVHFCPRCLEVTDQEGRQL